MTEREIILLGFQKEAMREHDEDESYYYVFDIVDGLTFITPSNEEIKLVYLFFEYFLLFCISLK